MPGFDVPPEEISSIGSVTITGSIDTNEVEVAGVATDVNSGSKSAGTQRVVIATDQPQLTAALKVDGSGVVQPVTFSGTSSVNTAQVAGTVTDVNSGNKSAGTQRVVLATDQPQLTNALKVDGSATTQPVSISGTVPVSGTVTANVGTTNGLALDATLTSGTQKTKIVDTGGTNIATVSAAGAVKTDSSATTQPVSVASLPLPAGASTLAKQPALGTAGTPSADVLTVQGVTSMTALKVDGSGVTQPVSGTVTSNVGTTNGLALDATITSGTQQTKVTDGTNIANVLKSDGTAAGQNSQMVAGSFKEITYTTTTAQAVASSDVSGYKSISVHITSQGGSSLITFQGSNDNSNWTPVSLINCNQSTTTSAQTATSAAAIYYGPINYRFFRLNVTGIVSGTTAGIVELYTLPASTISSMVASSQSGTWTVQPGNTANTTAWKVDGSAVTQPVSGTVTTNAGTNLNTSALALDATLTGGTTKAQTTDGTNVANVLKSDGTAAGQNSQLVANAYLSVAYTTTTSQAVASTDVGNYSWVSVDINTQGGSSTVTFQVSNDNTNWRNASLLSSLSVGSSNVAAVVSSTGAGVAYHGPLSGRYFRLNVTGIVSGTTAGTVVFSSLPRTLQSAGVLASQQGVWTVQPGNTANTTPWLVTPAAGTTGGYSFNNITTATTTTVKSGAGTLHSIITNTTAASATVTIYDNTAGSGTKIGTTTNPVSLLQMGPLTAIYDVAFATGLTIVTTGAQDLTITYK